MTILVVYDFHTCILTFALKNKIKYLRDEHFGHRISTHEIHYYLYFSIVKPVAFNAQLFFVFSKN